MTTNRIGILHPGEMGASIGAAAVTAGARVLWASDGRSAVTHRRAGEMREIARSFEANELPGGFHRAAADIFDRLSEYKDCHGRPELAEVVEVLLGGNASPGKGR